MSQTYGCFHNLADSRYLSPANAVTALQMLLQLNRSCTTAPTAASLRQMFNNSPAQIERVRTRHGPETREGRRGESVDQNKNRTFSPGGCQNSDAGCRRDLDENDI